MAEISTRDTIVPGCLEIETPCSSDQRGSFAKPFSWTAFSDAGFELTVSEIFHSTSRRGVVRGLHFQLPPRDLMKLVWCVRGQVLDVVVDLRAGSPAYASHHAVELHGNDGTAVLVPQGCAHGFQALSEEAIVGYAVTESFDSSCDAGVHWASAGIVWPLEDTVVSDRDSALPDLAAFDTPFRYSGD